MSLTRITSGVVSSNAISADKLANGSIDSRHLANTSVELKHLASSANLVGSVATVSTNLTANLVQITANINAVQSNLNATATNVSTVSGNVTRATINAESNVTAVEARRVANIAGAISTVLTADLTASRALASSGSGKIAVSDVTATELGYLDGVSGAIQTQIDGLTTNINTLDANADAIETRRVNNIAGAVSTITTADLTASRALVSGSGGKVEVSTTTSAQLGHLSGVTGAIQTQIDALETRRAANNVTTTFTDDVVITGNLIVNGDTTTANSVNMVVQDRMLMLANSATGAPAADIGLLFNRGNQGNAAIFYDESAKTFKLSDTKDPSSNTTLSPVTASNLDVGIITAATLNATAITQNGATLDNLIGSNVDGAISTVHDTDLTASRALASSGSGKIEVSAVTATELGYLDGVSSAIQTQFDALETRRAANNVTTTFTDDVTITGNSTIGKGLGLGGNTVPVDGTISLGQPANVIIRSVGGKGGNVIIGDATAVTNHLLDVRGTANVGALTSTSATVSGLTASKALQTDGSKNLESSSVTTTELGYISGVTGAVQTQLNDLTANDFVTYTRLNANINVVSGNAAVGLKQLTNVITSGGANTFHVATPPGSTNPTTISNVQVFIDGLAQKPKTSSSDNDYIYTAGTGLVTVTDASLPSGLTVQITSLYPPS